MIYVQSGGRAYGKTWAMKKYLIGMILTLLTNNKQTL